VNRVASRFLLGQATATLDAAQRSFAASRHIDATDEIVPLPIRRERTGLVDGQRGQLLSSATGASTDRIFLRSCTWGRTRCPLIY